MRGYHGDPEHREVMLNQKKETRIYALRSDVIIWPLEETCTASGIILIKNSPDNNEGIVVAIGAGFKDKALKVGDKIIYRKNEGVRFKLDGVMYLKLRSRWCECIYLDKK